MIAGALLAAALASVLHTFAAAIGLSMSSTAPTWRDTSFVLVLLSGLYLLLGRVRVLRLRRLRGRTAALAPHGGAADEIEFRDGVHGLLVWALATLLTGLLTLGAAQALTRLTAPTAARPPERPRSAGRILSRTT